MPESFIRMMPPNGIISTNIRRYVLVARIG